MAGDTSRLLRNALRTNAAFSGLCGLTLIIAPGRLAELIGLPWSWLLGALGIGLACFALLAAYAAGNPQTRRSIIVVIIIADVLWVAASPMAMLAAKGVLTAVGHGLIALVALIVAVLATAQWLGLRHANREPSA